MSKNQNGKRKKVTPEIMYMRHLIENDAKFRYCRMYDMDFIREANSRFRNSLTEFERQKFDLSAKIENKRIIKDTGISYQMDTTGVLIKETQTLKTNEKNWKLQQAINLFELVRNQYKSVGESETTRRTNQNEFIACRILGAYYANARNINWDEFIGIEFCFVRFSLERGVIDSLVVLADVEPQIAKSNQIDFLEDFERIMGYTAFDSDEYRRAHVPRNQLRNRILEFVRRGGGGGGDGDNAVCVSSPIPPLFIPTQHHLIEECAKCLFDLFNDDEEVVNEETGRGGGGGNATTNGSNTSTSKCPWVESRSDWSRNCRLYQLELLISTLDIFENGIGGSNEEEMCEMMKLRFSGAISPFNINLANKRVVDNLRDSLLSNARMIFSDWPKLNLQLERDLACLQHRTYGGLSDCPANRLTNELYSSFLFLQKMDLASEKFIKNILKTQAESTVEPQTHSNRNLFDECDENDHQSNTPENQLVNQIKMLELTDKHLSLLHGPSYSEPPDYEFMTPYTIFENFSRAHKALGRGRGILLIKSATSKLPGHPSHPISPTQFFRPKLPKFEL